MSKLIDFQYYRRKQALKKHTGIDNKRFELYRVVIECVNQNRPYPSDAPLEELTATHELLLLFQNERHRLTSTFADLIRFFDLDVSNEIPMIDFMMFKTIGDLCFYFEKRVK